MAPRCPHRKLNALHHASCHALHRALHASHHASYHALHRALRLTRLTPRIALRIVPRITLHASYRSVHASYHTSHRTPPAQVPFYVNMHPRAAAAKKHIYLANETVKFLIETADTEGSNSPPRLVPIPDTEDSDSDDESESESDSAPSVSF